MTVSRGQQASFSLSLAQLSETLAQPSACFVDICFSFLSDNQINTAINVSQMQTIYDAVFHTVKQLANNDRSCLL